MRALLLNGAFGLSNLQLVERPDPTPGPGQALLRLRAASLNYRDLLMVEGRYNPRQPLPLVPLSDGVGEIVAVGPGVDGAWIGRRACPTFARGYTAGRPTWERLRQTLGGPLDGVLQELIVADLDDLVAIPPSISDEEAATLPCAGLTAWNALVEQGGLRAGDTALVQGTGGVAIFALQIARMIGARVIATSSRSERLERLHHLGASHTLNYVSQPDWGKQARKLANEGEGVDLVVEVGGAKTVEQSLHALRPGGTLAIIGVLSGATEPLNLTPILMRNIRLQGVFVGHRDAFEGLVRAVDATGLRPVIDLTLPWTQAAAALERLKRQDHFGKIVLRFD